MRPRDLSDVVRNGFVYFVHYNRGFSRGVVVNTSALYAGDPGFDSSRVNHIFT